MNRFCPRCGSPVSPNARFCRNCGYKLLQTDNHTSGRYQNNSSYYNYRPNYDNQYQNMNYNYQNLNNGYVRSDHKTFSNSNAGLNAYLIKIYGWMFITMIVAGISAGFGSVSHLFVGSWMPIILAIIGWIPMWFVYRHAATDPAEGVLGLIAFAVIDGLSLSGIFLYYTGQDLSMAFVSSAIVFAVMSGIGMITQRDLSQLGTQLFGALIALIVVSIISLFFANSFILLFIDVVGVIIFSGFSIFDTNQAIKIFDKYKGQASVTGLALMSAMNLFIDFENLFIDLLQIIGAFNNNN